MNELDNQPKIFRKQQVADFLHQLDIASTFDGPDGTIYHDEFINMVMDEVQANETDLSEARVAIEQYVVSNLAKTPDNVMFMRLHDAIQPIIQAVIDIEIKMYGSPKFIVSKANSDASAWRIDGGAQTPIQNVSLPQDVADEVKKYSFINITETPPTLPEKTQDINDYRRSFFTKIENHDKDQSINEELWLKNFENEAVFDFLDKVIYAANFHDQVSMAVIENLTEYCIHGTLNGIQRRNDKALAYEAECNIPEIELAPDEFIMTARNSSLRALFTVLLLSEPEENSLKKVIQSDLKDTERTIDVVKADCLQSLIKLYAKHPIFKKDVTSLELVFQAIDEELRGHFYTALNDLASYYEERHFTASALNCYLLKEYLADLLKLQSKEEESKAEAVKTGPDAVVISSAGIFIE